MPDTIMSPLLSLCHELLHDIITKVEPSDIASLVLTCKLLRDYTRANTVLWRDAYLHNYVDVTSGERWDEG